MGIVPTDLNQENTTRLSSPSICSAYKFPSYRPHSVTQCITSNKHLKQLTVSTVSALFCTFSNPQRQLKTTCPENR
ncbi:Hypothetical predicted protein [Cloeon dipterum]|uniref:Uncharacterized protein n=1 Tax=Cloeon dipterum TaxID=197152 RepID=A0A8S1DLV3_9INSE|nr:Hypothetical predicted protein [Cloeon dipterum]